MPSRKQLANAVRILAADAVQAANSGHPGAPMGMADIAESLWRKHLRHNPANPAWPGRDRFVLSNGHASMLLYAVLHLSGYDVGMDDIKAFRQLGSRTPGHPEFGHTPGVETTTGPLGQGLGMAVGMALAEKLLADSFNRDGFAIVDHHTYVFAGDGCLMEGIAQEACSLAGTFGLGKLVVLYDDNGISIDGKVDGWFGDDTPARFRACGWNVIEAVDGHNAEAVDAALTTARSQTAKPTLICCRTVIGYGAPTKAASASCHGSPLGAAEINGLREALGWSLPPFEISKDYYEAWDAREAGTKAEQAWNTLFAEYSKAYPELAAEFVRRLSGQAAEGWDAALCNAISQYEQADAKAMLATRVASGEALSLLAPAMPELFGGSADLTGSVNTFHKSSKAISPASVSGNYAHYGVREFGMGAVMNGMALHGGFIPYGGTFLVFSDYMRGAIRLSALMRQKSVWVLTHDSIGLGEDGPTHQPVEHTASLRLMPGLHVWRPCDVHETLCAWRAALTHRGPSCLVLSRQNLPLLHMPKGELSRAQAVARGGYVLQDCVQKPQAVLIATGSEVAIALEAQQQLAAQGVAARVVSMPCTEVFDAQDAAWKEAVLPAAVRVRVAVEAGAVDSWWKYVGLEGHVVGMRSFGASAPADKLYAHFGITAEAVVAAVLHSLG